MWLRIHTGITINPSEYKGPQLLAPFGKRHAHIPTHICICTFRIHPHAFTSYILYIVDYPDGFTMINDVKYFVECMNVKMKSIKSLKHHNYLLCTQIKAWDIMVKVSSQNDAFMWLEYATEHILPAGDFVYLLDITWMSYCSGLPENLIKKLQRVQNTSARLVFNLRKYDRIIPAPVTLHWLPVKYRIEFKTLLIVFKGLHDQAPTYIQEMITPPKSKRYSIRSNEERVLKVPKFKHDILASVHLQCMDLWHGIACQRKLGYVMKLKHSSET